MDLITDNPGLSALVGATLTAIAAFFKPIMGALQAALVRRIDQAWQDHGDECNVEERVRKTAERVCSTTRFPLPRRFVEGHVRKRVSEPPDP